MKRPVPGGDVVRFVGPSSSYDLARVRRWRPTAVKIMRRFCPTNQAETVDNLRMILTAVPESRVIDSKGPNFPNVGPWIMTWPGLDAGHLPLYRIVGSGELGAQEGGPVGPPSCHSANN